MSVTEKNKNNCIRIISPSACRMCGFAQSYEIMITSLSSNDTGWIAKGKGKQISRTCPHCGQIYNAILNIIPIYCQDIPCPKCGMSQELHYTINKITTNEQIFNFVVEIKCAKCNKTNKIKKVISEFFSRIKIIIGPLGIKIERG